MQLGTIALILPVTKKIFPSTKGYPSIYLHPELPQNRSHPNNPGSINLYTFTAPQKIL